MYPFKPEEYPKELVSVETGQIVPANVNADNALAKGRHQMRKWKDDDLVHFMIQSSVL